MAYARYFKKKGKTFGPYYYESYRDKNGKIKKKYVGTVDPDAEIKENICLDNKVEENIAERTSNLVTPTNSNVKFLVFMIILLILMDVLFLLFYLR